VQPRQDTLKIVDHGAVLAPSLLDYLSGLETQAGNRKYLFLLDQKVINLNV
jgi:hypothetical protein